MLRRVESRGVLETAHRLMNYCGNIYRSAVATGFVRPGELRKAEWSQIDLEAGEWRIPRIICTH